MYIAISGIQHAGKDLADDVAKVKFTVSYQLQQAGIRTSSIVYYTLIIRTLGLAKEDTGTLKQVLHMRFLLH